MSPPLLESILVGRSRDSLQRVLLVTAGLALASFASVSVARYLTPGVDSPIGDLFYPLVLLNTHPALAALVIPGWISLSGIVAYHQNGVLGSWVILFGPLFGGLASDFVFDNLCCAGATTSARVLRESYTLNSHVVNVLLAFVTALGFALVLGTFGYVLGRGAKTIVRQRSGRANA